jgi:hypothetical protein
MEFNIEKALEYYEKENNITLAAKKHCKDLGIPYGEKYRLKLSRYINNNNDLENETTTETKGYEKKEVLMPSAWSAELNKFLTIEEYCDKYGLDKSTVKSSKLISHVAGHMTYNIVFYTPEEEAVVNIDNHLEELIQKYIKPFAPSLQVLNHNDTWFDRLVYTDVHLAMDVNGDGDPMYEGVWDRNEAMRRLELMIEHVKRFKMSETLIIDDLGDFMDGLGAQTTRRGHHLPQNMNDKEAFELGMDFKLYLVDSLAPYYNKIICNNITNDNHSGVFGFFVSSAAKRVLEQRYSGKVEINVIKRFMSHYSVGKHTFVLTHGKDMGEQKFGMKPKLDAIQADKIDQYCKEHSLYNGNYIELSKGDSHQAVYDETTSKDFHYYNYPAFSPPSNWVKTNFGKSPSGFRFYNINREDNIKIITPYYFE